MVSSLRPHLFDVNEAFEAERAGYALGKDQYQRQTNAFAGQKLAQGNYKGAKNAFFEAGDIEGGFKIQSHIDQMDDRQRAATKRITDIVGNAAMLADNPESWGRLIDGLKKRGLDVERFRDFSTREAAIAEAGMTSAYIERADKLKQQTADNDYRERVLKNTADSSARTSDLAERTFEYGMEKDQTDAEAAAAKARAEAAKPDIIEINKRALNKKNLQWVPKPTDEAEEPDGDLPEEVRKAFATKDAATATAYAEGSQKANEADATLAQIEAQRAKTNWEGPNLGIRRGLGRVFGGFPGVSTPSDDLAAMDAMDASATQLGLKVAEAAKGTMSEADREIIFGSVPNSNMTDEAAKPVIVGMKAANIRARARAEFYDEWIRANKSGRGFEQAWNRFINEKPIFAKAPDGTLSVNQENATAWREYLTRRGQPTGQPQPQRQPLPEGGFAATKRPAAPYGFDAPSTAKPAPKPAATKPLSEMTDEELLELDRQYSGGGG